MYDRSAIPKLVFYSVLSLVLSIVPCLVWAQQSTSESENAEYRITDFKSNVDTNTLSIEIAGTSIPAFTVSEEFAPFKVNLDISGAVFAENVSPQLPNNSIAKMAIADLNVEQLGIKRFSFELSDTHDYKIDRASNNIQIKIYPSTSPSPSASSAAITDIKVDKKPDLTTITLVGNANFASHKVGSLDGSNNQPARLFIDIPDISITNLVRELNVGTSVSRVRVAPRGTGARFVLDSSNTSLFPYQIKESPTALMVLVQEKSAMTQPKDTVANVSQSGEKPITEETLEELIESSSGLLPETDMQQPSQTDQLEDTFSFAGYNKQRISVDFYKIDVHNVFRLFRQITDQNIIVAEGVGGTLTLALSDVPWDFALDIILNLLDLEKEERFNTIVIYPKKKEFNWPERAEDNLSFEADVEVVQQESLIIEESANQPQEILEAKDLIKQAQKLEKNNDFEDAAARYEQAVKLWPDNAKIYNRLSTIYLVNLGMNAKALHFAKESLKADNKNLQAALYAAIASANMQRKEEASEYFTQAISGEPPMKEALFSFAAFSENNDQAEIALKLLEKYDEYYGENVNTMLAKARLYDKLKQTDKATAQYRSIMASGYQIRPDLKKYILGRIAAGTN